MHKDKAMGMAKFGVDGTGDYSVSMNVYVSIPSAANGEAHYNTRLGLTFFDEATENSTSYVYVYRANGQVIIRNINASNNLYYDAGSGATRDYFGYGKGNNNLTSGTQNFKLEIKKVGTTISAYLNDKLLESFTVSETIDLTPTILSFSGDDWNKKVMVKYSNIVVKTGTQVTA